MAQHRLLERIGADSRKIREKGTLLYIEGKIRSRSYDDQNGVKRYITEIVADNLELLGRRVQENDTGGSTGMIETNDPVDNMDDASSEVDDLPF